MRRPLKPFVTEYKGARRPPQSQPGFGALQTTDPQAATPANMDAPNPAPRSPKSSSGFDNDWSRSKPFDMATKSDPDDAYEAAMRAADALFTRPNRPESEPEPDTTSARPPAATHAASAAESGSAAPPERGGRILRAIDEPPSQEFAALEAAYAPKRRGRKPGSKNKPKVPTTPPSEPIAALLPDDVSIEPTRTASAAAPPVPARPTLEAIESPNGALRAERRALWSRDKLKPGEGWKRRRLPRVCW